MDSMVSDFLTRACENAGPLNSVRDWANWCRALPDDLGEADKALRDWLEEIMVSEQKLDEHCRSLSSLPSPESPLHGLLAVPEEIESTFIQSGAQALPASGVLRLLLAPRLLQTLAGDIGEQISMGNEIWHDVLLQHVDEILEEAGVDFPDTPLKCLLDLVVSALGPSCVSVHVSQVGGRLNLEPVRGMEVHRTSLGEGESSLGDSKVTAAGFLENAKISRGREQLVVRNLPQENLTFPLEVYLGRLLLVSGNRVLTGRLEHGREGLQVVFDLPKDLQDEELKVCYEGQLGDIVESALSSSGKSASDLAATVSALGQLAWELAWRPLLLALSHEASEVRQAAINALQDHTKTQRPILPDPVRNRLTELAREDPAVGKASADLLEIWSEEGSRDQD